MECEHIPFVVSIVLIGIPFAHGFQSTTSASYSWKRRPARKHLYVGSMVEENEPVWDPVAQIYVGGVLPGTAEVNSMIAESGGTLRVFGYGSLCWNPGTDGALAHPSVKRTLGRARGYRRCWAQKSTDHRGDSNFPGIVCTLLRDEEFRLFRTPESDEETLTEGMLYEVRPALVAETLAELDFREKGGYARNVINVIEDASGKTVQALLYRGTPDNPAFWPRALCDLSFAASTIAVSVGPSGRNEVYLHQLDNFLEAQAEATVLAKFDDTFKLAALTKEFMKYELSFVFGSGSNQHNQLLLNGHCNAAGVAPGEDTCRLTEFVVCSDRPNAEQDRVVNVFAGGGHSGVLFESGRLCLFGWNDSGQLGRAISKENRVADSELCLIPALDKIAVETCALGHNHTLLIERGTRKVFAFGENSRAQLGVPMGQASTAHVLPAFLSDDRAVQVAVGLFHSAVVTEAGELVTFGCNRFGQNLNANSEGAARWQPDDGCRVLKIACGRRHTVAIDERHRVWSFGDNKYGQLGRQCDEKSPSNNPFVVEGAWNETVYIEHEVYSGWSHTIVAARTVEGDCHIYGWGRNDKGQLGVGIRDHVTTPIRLFALYRVDFVACGSEFTTVVANGILMGCGWNEHGNLAVEHTNDVLQLERALGAPVTVTPGYPLEAKLAVAAGGAHIIAMKI